MHADKDLTAKLSLLHHLQINTHLYLHFGYLLFIFMKPVNKFIFSFVKYSETSVRAEGMEEGKKYHYAISVNCFYIHQPNRYMYQPFNVLETRGRKNSSQVQTLTFFANWGLLCTAFRFSLDFFSFVSTPVDFHLNNEGVVDGGENVNICQIICHLACKTFSARNLEKLPRQSTTPYIFIAHFVPKRDDK